MQKQKSNFFCFSGISVIPDRRKVPQNSAASLRRVNNRAFAALQEGLVLGVRHTVHARAAHALRACRICCTPQAARPGIAVGMPKRAKQHKFFCARMAYFGRRCHRCVK